MTLRDFKMSHWSIKGMDSFVVGKEAVRFESLEEAKSGSLLYFTPKRSDFILWATGEKWKVFEHRDDMTR